MSIDYSRFDAAIPKEDPAEEEKKTSEVPASSNCDAVHLSEKSLTSHLLNRQALAEILSKDVDTSSMDNETREKYRQMKAQSQVMMMEREILRRRS